MKLTGDRREVLKVLASKEKVPLYEIMKLNQANFRARISELRAKGFDIPAPVIRKRISTYTLPPAMVTKANAVLLDEALRG